jgi:hypothetical protein
VAYVIPVALGLRARLRGSQWPAAALWNLGKYGAAVNAVALVYTGFISVVLMMPPNELAGKTLAGVLVLLALIYVFEVRRRFQGPKWALAVAPSGESTK